MQQHNDSTQRINTVVIGAGQAGLSTGYHLSKLGVPFVILDANARIGDSWRHRWDSLRLFTPTPFAGLDGLRLPARAGYFPTKDEMADFLELYARTFSLPVRSGVRVDRLSRCGNRYLVVAGDQRYDADHVVVAMSGYQTPRVPAFADQLSKDIVQLHSLDYRRPSQLQSGDVLIVGAGNSGAEIALDLAHDHRVWLAGRNVGEVPFRVETFIARHVLVRFALRVIFHRILTVKTPIGRRVRPKVLHVGGVLVRTKTRDLDAAGVQRVPRVAGARDGQPLLEDGRVISVANVVWCTGFHPGFSWIDLPVFDERGDPRHEGGTVPEFPGLYFVGLHFLYAFSSTMIHGVGRDAERIARTIAASGTREAARPAARRESAAARDRAGTAA